MGEGRRRGRRKPGEKGGWGRGGNAKNVEGKEEGGKKMDRTHKIRGRKETKVEGERKAKKKEEMRKKRVKERPSSCHSLPRLDTFRSGDQVAGKVRVLRDF